MTSSMGAGWVPERQRHQFLVGVSGQNPWSLVALGCTRLAAPLLWSALRAVLGTDDEGGVLLLMIAYPRNCGGLEAKLTTTTTAERENIDGPISVL